MSQEPNCAIAVIRIDIGKNSFHVVGHDQRGAIVLRQKWSRGQVETRLANLPPCLIGMDACVGAHHLSRKLQALGHQARLMPAKYVRPYSKGQKNDFRDAEAIAEAVQRPTMKFVATKTTDQLDLQALHRVRERLVSQRTGVINQIRAFLLERGVTVTQGLRFLRTELPGIVATRGDVLSPRMLRLVEDLATDWRRLDARIEALSGEIEALARQDQHCERLMTVPASARSSRARWWPRSAPGTCSAKAATSAPLSARAVRSGGLGRTGQAQARALGTLWSQVLDRGGEAATAPQRARHCAGQQARPHRLGGFQQGARLHVRQDRCDGVPSSVIRAPCSGPNKAWPGCTEARRKATRRPALTASARAGRDEGTAARHEQRNSTK
jgi:transposase